MCNHNVSQDLPDASGNRPGKFDRFFEPIGGAPRLINRVLEVNSCHVPLEATERFAGWSHLVGELNGGWPIHLDALDDGSPVILSGTEEEMRELGFTDESVLNLLRLAQRAGCFLLRIHQVGPVYDDLPTFEW